MNSLVDALQTFRSDDRDRGWIYAQLGVDPIVNCSGTRSTFGGSNPTALVRMGMSAASDVFVDLDELAEGAGRHISHITGAEWGLVTSGSVAALVLSTVASMVGNDPAGLIRLPNVDGLKRGVLIAQTHRFPYDLVVRSVGAELIAFKDLEELADLADQACLVCLLGRAELSDPLLSLEAIRLRVGSTPIVVDAAGLSPARPDPWLERGADLVIYSGGKYLQGPQSTGFLIGSKRLCCAATAANSPHTSICRGMKVGKEEIVGALVALEQWLSDDNLGERQSGWEQTLEAIAKEVRSVFRVGMVKPTAAALTPRLRLSWDPQSTITAAMLSERLRSRYRIQLPDFGPAKRSVEIDPFNISDPIEADMIARALRAAFADLEEAERYGPSCRSSDEIDTGDPLTGQWSVTIDFAVRCEQHSFVLMQEKKLLSGRHDGRISSGSISGSADGTELSFVAIHPAVPMDAFYTFHGRQSGDRIEGVVLLGAAAPEHYSQSLCRQFGHATWTAQRQLSRGEI